MFNSCSHHTFFYSQPSTKQPHGSYENEGLSGMLKLCTAVMRHDPSFKMSPAGLVSDPCNHKYKDLARAKSEAIVTILII